MRVYLNLFISFLKVGTFAFGGGYAMLPLFRKELVKKNNFITEEQLLDYYSLGQCIPGIIAINVSIFTGYKLKGLMGAIVSSFAMVLPSLVIILGIANLLMNIEDSLFLKHVLSGIRLGVIALLINEVIYLFKKEVKNKFQISIFIISAILLMFSFTTITVILCVLFIAFVNYYYNIRSNK